MKTHTQIDLKAIHSGRLNPRRDLDAATLEGLGKSLGKGGGQAPENLVEPVVLVEVGAGKYEIVAGERRISAARAAGYQAIDAVVHSGLGASDAHRLRVLENLHREALHPLDQALGLRMSWLLANAEAMGILEEAESILGKAKGLGEAAGRLEKALLAAGFVPTHPVVSWGEVLESLGIDMDKSRRKRLLRVLNVEPALHARVRSLGLTEAALVSLGQVTGATKAGGGEYSGLEAQEFIVQAVEETPTIARRIRRICRVIRGKNAYTLEDAVNEARGILPGELVDGPGMDNGESVWGQGNDQENSWDNPDDGGWDEEKTREDGGKTGKKGRGKERGGEREGAWGNGYTHNDGGGNVAPSGGGGDTMEAAMQLLEHANLATTTLQDVAKLLAATPLDSFAPPWDGYARDALKLIQQALNEFQRNHPE